jgi:SAM-dependent methyltransferase
MLDVGCGNGRLLDRFKLLGWNTYGVELLPRAAQEARLQGHQVFVGDIMNFDSQANSYDVVTLCHVLEHLYDPLSTLKKCYELLTDDGLLVIEVPNYDCRDALVYRENWLGAEIPIHLTHWTPGSLEHVLLKSGFIPSKWGFFKPSIKDSLTNIRYRCNSKFKSSYKHHFAILLLDEIKTRVEQSIKNKKNISPKYGHFMTVYCRKGTQSQSI